MKSLENNNYQAIVISPEISKCCANKIHNTTKIIPLSKQITLPLFYNFTIKILGKSNNYEVRN